MTTSTVSNIITTTTGAIGSNLGAILPIIIPAAVALAVFFLAVHWFFNAAGRT